MGFFSWMADTNQPIMNVHTGEHETVYMLSPRDSFREDEYDGYGVFGGKDAYVHLAEMNGFKRKEGQSDNEFRLVGIELEMGELYLNLRTGDLLRFPHEDRLFEWVKQLETGWSNGQKLLDGMTMNEAVGEKTVVNIPVRPLMLKGNKYFPLKFSFNPEAKYADLPAAENEPGQGFSF